MQWHSPVVPATQEAEAGGSLEIESPKLQLAMIVSLHTAWVTEQDLVSKTKNDGFLFGFDGKSL